uniref:Ribosomal protein L36 n=1 Tax=Microlaena stipoides TaxID=66030 RepID=E9KJI3_9POAL|nr:ribosomal protein L36 [Microlaena stipoides]
MEFEHFREYFFFYFLESKVLFSKYYPCLCLCFGLEQMTLIRPRLRISRHFVQILRTEALIFIFPYSFLKL